MALIFKYKKAKESTITIEEMNIGIQRIAMTSNQISESSILASEEAERGNESTNKSVAQMNAISKAVNQSATSVKLLGDHSNKIEEIVGIITGIASQTNLLALNAAIEAARAGRLVVALQWLLMRYVNLQSNLRHLQEKFLHLFLISSMIQTNL